MGILLSIFAAVLTRAADLASVTPEAASGNGTAFELEGDIIPPCNSNPGRRWAFNLRDSSGTVVMHCYFDDRATTLRAGDRVKAGGRVLLEHGGVFPHCERIEVTGHREPDPPVPTTIRTLADGGLEGEFVKVRGEITDIFTDEIDALWYYFALSDDGRTIYLPVKRDELSAAPDELIGARIEVSGSYVSGNCTGNRQSIGHYLNRRDGLKIISPSTHGIFDAKPLDARRTLDPSALATLGWRRVRGTVLACWHGDRTLLRTEDGRLMRLDLVSAAAPPVGTVIEAVGMPATDLYRLNLSRARWRRVDGAAFSPGEPVEITMKELFTDAADRPRINPELHGRRVKIRGTVRALPSPGAPERRLLLEDGGFQLPVDITGRKDCADGLVEGCRVETTGICITEIENWRPDLIFPTISGIVIVPGPDDPLTVLSRPSWWTPGRLLAVIGALLAALVTVLLGAALWNRSLRTLAERRGRELNEESIARVTADLKVYERTRLAVELHDSIAQNLTGVSLEIKTALRLAAGDAAAMMEHLETAGSTLESCRQELRNCLWDLRHHALEQSDMGAAIRQTLAPVLGTKPPTVNIRFAVPREMLTDNTAHAILRIIRELTVNALRHGSATEIRIAGAVEGGRLLFSVTDNGCGFDPASAPGAEEGHFGLEGIRERVSAFNGSLALRSSPGRGTRAVVSVDLPSAPAGLPSVS